MSSALTWLGGGAIIGAGLGALSYTDKPTGALLGAESGVALVGIGGLVVAIFSPKGRDAGITAAGVGLGGLALLGITMSLIAPKAMVGAAGPPRMLAGMPLPTPKLLPFAAPART